MARAQQGERVRRIGTILPAVADDMRFRAYVGAFLEALALLGWTIGRNARIDTRWATANAAEICRHAEELAVLAPDVILAHGTLTVAPSLQATRIVPIVFPIAVDPVGAGLVASLLRGVARLQFKFTLTMAAYKPHPAAQIARGVAVISGDCLNGNRPRPTQR
jgi:putative tryptophan/tyrosine transport system substrate-binding protein